MARRREATPVWIGIDVAKQAIDVARGSTGPLERVERALGPLQQWARTLPKQARVVLEATGGLKHVGTTVLRARGIAVCVVNPRQVRDFAKATGQLAKTDGLDARVLAHFGAALLPRVTLARASDVDALRALLDRRRQLVETRTAEKNRRQTASEAVRGSIDDHIAWLDQQIEQLDQAIAGAATACTQRGRRAIWGGRGDARAMLFLAAQSAARWNPPLRHFYERLVSRGKSKKAALAAVARKLLIAINAMMRDQRPWQPAIVAEPSCC